MNTSFPDRLPDVGESIFTRMSLMSKQHNSINLGQGFPDFAPPAELIELTYRYAKEGFNQYAQSAGLPELRKALSGKIERLYGTGYDAESEITITSGATEALFCAILCTIQSGDEVLIIEPAYDSYAPAVRMAGGIPIYYAIDIQNPQIDWADLEKRITANTKMLIINNPHNPLGIVFGQEDIDRLEHIAVAHDLWLIADEVYEHITFEDVHRSLSQSKILKSRSFVISSFGKTYHNTGWKIGYCAAPKMLTEAFRKVHQFVTFSTFTPAQKALSDILSNDSWYKEIQSFYNQKRALVTSLLQESPYRFTPTMGSYFQTISFSSVSSLSDVEFADHCTKHLGVTVIPLSPFFHDRRNTGTVRICFAKADDTLIVGLDRLCKILK